MIFCEFQPGVSYKSVAYKKKCVFVQWANAWKKLTPLAANDNNYDTQLTFTSSKSTIETLEKSVKYVQSQQ